MLRLCININVKSRSVKYENYYAFFYIRLDFGFLINTIKIVILFLLKDLKKQKNGKRRQEKHEESKNRQKKEGQISNLRRYGT